MFLEKNTKRELIILIGISIYAFYVNWISGNIGILPIDSFGFLDTGHSILRGKLPIRVHPKTPILFIYYKNDPWFNYDNCKDFVKTRNSARVVELEGSAHETSSNQIARDSVAEFFSKHKN